jgi:hypothetical protein
VKNELQYSKSSHGSIALTSDFSDPVAGMVQSRMVTANARASPGIRKKSAGFVGYLSCALYRKHALHTA